MGSASEGAPGLVDSASSASEGATACAISSMKCERAASPARRIAFSIASASERPWLITPTPFTPTSGAPPTSRQSIRFFIPSRAVFESRPPIFARIEEWSARFRYSPTTFAVPSIVFRATLPVKPSVVMTSNSPVRRSRPSQ